MATSWESYPSPGPSSPAEPIAIDPLFEDEGYDPAPDDENVQSTKSLTSTFFKYRKLHGRTFHNFKDAEYWGPNDESQSEGEAYNHHMLYLALDNRLYLAPLENPQKILDVGTGTGFWAMDIADKFPEAEVIGVDLSPTQPTWIPPNCRFDIDDASQDWTFKDNTFDYIHIRFMAGCFKDWAKLYRECYRCLKPGGFIEHLDFSLHVRSDDGSIPPDSIWSQWYSVFVDAGERLGQTFEVIDGYKWVGWMQEAGFAEVQTRAFKTAVGAWPANPRQKEIGRYNRFGLEKSLEGFALYLLTNVLGWEYEKVQSWLAKVREAIRDKRYHGYTTWAAACAQKPKA